MGNKFLYANQSKAEQSVGQKNTQYTGRNFSQSIRINRSMIFIYSELTIS